MPRPTNFPYCFSLRLASGMQTELEDMAYQFRISRAQFIRRALRRAIVEAHQHDQSLETVQFQAGAR